MRKIPKIGPYSNPDVLGKLDGRTKEARLLRTTRAELAAHVGNAPSATQRALIERAAQLSLRLGLMDASFAETGAMSEAASKTYLAWSNTLARTLARLGMQAAKAPAKSLAQHVAERSGVAA